MTNNIVWCVVWRLAVLGAYPVLTQVTQAHAMDAANHVARSSVEQWAHTNSFSLILGTCFAAWIAGAVVGTAYPVPEDLRAAKIEPWLRFLICLVGGAAAFLYVLNTDKTLTLLMPIWVGGVAFVSPHLIQILPKLVMDKLGIRGK